MNVPEPIPVQSKSFMHEEKAQKKVTLFLSAHTCVVKNTNNFPNKNSKF